MHDDHAQLESLLTRYRPAGPAPELRGRLLSGRAPARTPQNTKIWSFASAAVWLLCCGLWFECSRLDHRTREMLAAQPAVPPEARSAIALLGGDEQARQYVRLALSTHGPIQNPNGELQ